MTDVISLNLEPIDGGWRVKISDDGRHYIDVLRMLYNWRLVTTPIHDQSGYSRGWCYFGHGDGPFAATGEARTMEIAFRNAVMAAWVWDGSDDSEPPGYDKRVGG